MAITIIAAVSENNVIGKNGKIPWKIQEDMRRFKELTIGNSVIMGRKTYESLPQKFRPLPERRNIVLTHGNLSDKGVYVAHSIAEALEYCNNLNGFIIGGGEVYNQSLLFADFMEITKVRRNIEGDSYFPEVNWDNWIKTNEINREEYSFLSFRRKNGK